MSAPSSSCSLCGKSIPKAASIKRHERYCRRRLAQPVPPRRKSCLSCIRAKIRCDFHAPDCGPCQRKGRECIFSDVSTRFAEGASSAFPTQSGHDALASASVENRGISENTSFYETLETHLPLLQPRNRQRGKSLLISKLVSQVIFSYAERKVDETSYLPFIHHSTFLRSMVTDDPIIICQDVVQKFTVRDSSVWETISAEQERIYQQRTSSSKWRNLSSAQAITVYLLMLTAEREYALNHYSDLPIALLFTLGAIFRQLNYIHPGYVTVEERREDIPVWEDWIFAESKLRTATVYFILSLLYNVNFGLPCDHKGDTIFEDVDVPAARKLWEAKDDLSWRDEFSPARETRLKYGDLVRLNKQEIVYVPTQNIDSRLAARVEKWHKEMDELGMLVSLCGTMV